MSKEDFCLKYYNLIYHDNLGDELKDMLKSEYRDYNICLISNNNYIINNELINYIRLYNMFNDKIKN
jgi:hypothetical protein